MPNAGENIEQLELSYIAGREQIMLQLFWKIVLAVPKKIKHRIGYDPLVPLAGIYQREKNTHVHIENCMQYS